MRRVSCDIGKVSILPFGQFELVVPRRPWKTEAEHSVWLKDELKNSIAAAISTDLEKADLDTV
jgi:hypothetical protein